MLTRPKRRLVQWPEVFHLTLAVLAIVLLSCNKHMGVKS